MKLIVELPCIGLALNSCESKDKDGNPKVYYSILILAPDGQAGMLSCADEVAVHWEKDKITPMTGLVANNLKVLELWKF